MTQKVVLQAALARLEICCTPAQIEKTFQAAIQSDEWADHSDIRHACNKRARELANTCRRGNLLAVRLDKGRGHSRRYSVNGIEYRTGQWGNGPGFRWVMAGFEQWYEQQLRESGLRSKDKIRLIINWIREGYDWRALRILADRS